MLRFFDKTMPFILSVLVQFALAYIGTIMLVVVVLVFGRNRSFRNVPSQKAINSQTDYYLVSFTKYFFLCWNESISSTLCVHVSVRGRSYVRISVSHPWSSGLYGWIACMEKGISRVVIELKTPYISNSCLNIIDLEVIIHAIK